VTLATLTIALGAAASLAVIVVIAAIAFVIQHALG
jgi:hypothetical protein